MKFWLPRNKKLIETLILREFSYFWHENKKYFQMLETLGRPYRFLYAGGLYIVSAAAVLHQRHPALCILDCFDATTLWQTKRHR